jgi:hypothetical protein
VTAENLERNDAGVTEQIARHAAVEYLKGAIIAGIGEQRMVWVISDSTNGFAVVAECLVRARRQVDVVPE